MVNSAGDDNASSALPPLTVNVYVRQQQVCSAEFTSQLELGRRRPGEPAPYTRHGDRLTIADVEENDVSRRHLHLELQPDGQLRITNLSQLNRVALGTDRQIKPGEHCDVTPPSLLSLGDRVIQIEPSIDAQAIGVLDSFLHQTLPPSSAEK